MNFPVSAGLLMYRYVSRLEVFIIHPGGPFFIGRDDGTWSIPKGTINEGETLLEAAIREFNEETGLVSSEPYISLGNVRQRGGKTVHAWAFKGDWDGKPIISNNFELEWPPKSGQIQIFPEVDYGDFLPTDTARKRLNPAQISFVDRLEDYLKWNL
jgi:predicted NUDIX family NTP pyrophosphohydrolase